MAIKAGQILHDVHGFVIDRIQTGGVSNVNIPETKIYELGNYNTVATVRDVPDLSFDLESVDVSTEVEAILHGVDPTTTIAGQEFDFQTYYPIDVISPFKAGNGNYTIVKGIVVPYLTLETVQYQFGVQQNASQQYTLRGDGVYYVPGVPYYQSYTLVNNTLTYNLSHTAIPYVESGNTLYVLGACVKNVSTGAYKRLSFGSDANGYTNTSSSVTTITDWFDSGYTTLHVVYGSTASTTYPQTVHQGISVKPGAVRSKDINVYVSDNTATTNLLKWHGVQSVQVTRQVNLDNDEEFGNSHYVSTDYDTADVNGNIVVRSSDAADLWTKIAQITDTPTNQISGPISAIPLELEIVISDPDTGSTLKTIYIPDAKFTVPATQGRVQQKLEVTFPFASQGGFISVFKGDRP